MCGAVGETIINKGLLEFCSLCVVIISLTSVLSTNYIKVNSTLVLQGSYVYQSESCVFKMPFTKSHGKLSYECVLDRECMYGGP